MPGKARVSLVKCATYVAGLEAAIRRLLHELGGMEAFVKAGQKVLIKPNLLTDRVPSQAVTTHPEVVRAVIRLVRAAGGEPTVGDSPSCASRVQTVWEKTGFQDLCKEEDVPLLSLEKTGSRCFRIAGRDIHVAQAVLEADVVISVPKVKTHVLTTLTGAVKNLYGTLPGFHKTHLHRDLPRPADFGRLVAGICRHVNAALHIADGVLGMEGNGPSAGKPVALDFLAASTNAFALDMTLCRILDISPSTVPYLKDYLKSDAGLAAIEVAGANMEDITPGAFLKPISLARLMPAWLMGPLGPLLWFRPELSDRCVACGRCVKACPCGALGQSPGQKPVLAPEKCIGCCCCHEVCPENSIEMTQSPLLRVLRRGRMP